MTDDRSVLWHPTTVTSEIDVTQLSALELQFPENIPHKKLLKVLKIRGVISNEINHKDTESLITLFRQHVAPQPQRQSSTEEKKNKEELKLSKSINSLSLKRKLSQPTRSGDISLCASNTVVSCIDTKNTVTNVKRNKQSIHQVTNQSPITSSFALSSEKSNSTIGKNDIKSSTFSVSTSEYQNGQSSSGKYVNIPKDKKETKPVKLKRKSYTSTPGRQENPMEISKSEKTAKLGCQDMEVDIPS